MRLRSLSFKLALLVGMLGLLQAVAILVFSYNTMSRSLAEQRRHVVQDTLIEVTKVVDRQASSAAISAAAYQLAEVLGRHEGMHVAIERGNKEETLVAFSEVGKESVHQLKTATWAVDAFLEWQSKDSGRQMLSLASTGSTKNGDQYVLVLTADRGADDEILKRFLLTALTAAPFVLALVSLGALAIVHIGLKPLNRFRDAAIAVTTKNLSTRINPAHLPSELLPLGKAFNGMLDRLDDGIRRLSQFSGDLAHEMRTPLGILLGRTQVALSQQRTKEDLLQALEENVEEIERLNRLVTDMLFLAHADSSSFVLAAKPVELSTLASEIVDFMELPAEERGMSFRISGNAIVNVDSSLIQRAITNLVSNAIRYGTPNGVIDLNITSDESTVRFSVINHGEQIPVKHQVRLFDRFYRTEFSRAREAGGSGLGLSIVKAIMHLHRGSVEVQSNVHGETRFTLIFIL
jgi:two-component system heavy metal sensor histidine kinase CusS